MVLTLVTVFSSGCVTISRRHNVPKEGIRIQLQSSENDLLASYNSLVRSVQTIQATVVLVPSTGTTYSGVIEEYHEVPGFILAERPATVRVIGQAPVVAKNIFDMVSDGQEFRIYIPSKNAFLVGPTTLSRASNKPLENLRPQHIVEALFWPELPPSANVLFEQFDYGADRFYILTLLRQTISGKFEIARKIWYSRVDLRVSRVQLFGAGGQLDSDIEYSDWQPAAAPSLAAAGTSAASSAAPQTMFARNIRIWRPQDDYKLQIQVQKLTLNDLISADRFALLQPEGTDLLRVGEDTIGKKP